jgi:hypothetical protein
MQSPTPNNDHDRQPPATPEAPTASGRDANGRFTKGNPGGPGNPYYRRQAHLKRVLLEAITDDDVRSVVQVLLGLARGGDLAAIKLYLHYAAGRPAREVDPDRAELHEWQLQKQSPPLGEVIGLPGQNLPAAEATRAVRDTLPIVANCQLQRLSQSLRDGRDFQGEQIAPPLEETVPPDRNGGKRPTASAQRMAGGVRPPANDQDDDEGDEDFLPWFKEDIDGPVQTGDNGDEDATRRPGGGASRGNRNGFRPRNP